MTKSLKSTGLSLSKDKQDALKKRARDAARAESLLAIIERRKARIAEDFYDIGEALREIAAKALYRAVGFASFEALLTARNVMSGEQARKLIRVVERFPRSDALTLGQEKAYALVAYASATSAADVPADLVRADAKVGRKKISKASVRDIKAATREIHAQERKKAPKSKEALASERQVRELIRRVKARLAKIGIARAKVEIDRQRIRIEVARRVVEAWR